VEELKADALLHERNFCCTCNLLNGETLMPRRYCSLDFMPHENKSNLLQNRCPSHHAN
jgi:hypothetical protein